MTDEDDDDIWLEHIKTVKPLRHRSGPKVTPEPKRIKLSAIKQYQPDVPRFERRASPLPGKQIKKLKTQQFAIEAKLDLHGFTVDNAHQSLERFLAHALRMELRCLEIITGRGNPHLGTGQLRRLVPLWLETSSVRNAILHIDVNPASRGGSLLILLRRTKSDN